LKPLLRLQFGEAGNKRRGKAPTRGSRTPDKLSSIFTEIIPETGTVKINHTCGNPGPNPRTAARKTVLNETPHAQPTSAAPLTPFTPINSVAEAVGLLPKPKLIVCLIAFLL